METAAITCQEGFGVRELEVSCPLGPARSGVGCGKQARRGPDFVSGFRAGEHVVLLVSRMAWERKAVESGDHRHVGGARGFAEHLLDGEVIGGRDAHEFLGQDDYLRALRGQTRDAIRVGVRHGQRHGWAVRFKRWKIPWPVAASPTRTSGCCGGVCNRTTP